MKSVSLPNAMESGEYETVSEFEVIFPFFQILHCCEDDLVPEENADQLHEVATIEREKDSRKR